MGETLSGLVYPDDDDPVRVPQDIKNLADSVEPFIRVPVCKLTRSSDQNIAHDTDVAVLWNSEVIDTHTMHSTSVNTNRVTPPVPGLYLVQTALIWRGTADESEAGLRQVTIRKNGADQPPVGRVEIGEQEEISITTGTFCTLAMDGVTDYIDVTARQTNTEGTVRRIWGGGGGSFSSVLEVIYLRPIPGS